MAEAWPVAARSLMPISDRKTVGVWVCTWTSRLRPPPVTVTVPVTPRRARNACRFGDRGGRVDAGWLALDRGGQHDRLAAGAGGLGGEGVGALDGADLRAAVHDQPDQDQQGQPGDDGEQGDRAVVLVTRDPGRAAAAG